MRRLHAVPAVGALLASMLAATPATAARVTPVGPSSPAPRVVVATPLHIDVFGDSISAQCGYTPPAGYCGPLGSLLAQAGVAATFTNHALSGSDCGYTSARVVAWLAVDHPDLVILDCGTNQDTSTAAAITLAGEQWRTIVEADHTYNALTLVSFVQYSNATIQAVAGRSWLEPSEERFNDQVVYANLHYYQGVPGWLAGLVDLQQVPSSSDYTLRRNSTGGWDGIHPTQLGYEAYARLIYIQLATYYGWPAVTAQPCGMTGAEARGPTYEQYISWTQCTGKTP